MKKKHQPSQQLWSGSWYRIDDSYWHECCDCGLVHGVDFRLEDGRILMRWTVNEKHTVEARKVKKAEKIKAKKKRV